MTQVMNIPLDMIDTAPQVRTKFPEASIAELAADIKAHGVLQPLVVQQNGERFTLLIGERRLRAIRYLGEAVAPAIVGTVSADMAKEVQLIENIQREDLNTKDLACAIEQLWKKHKSVSAVARRCNKSPSWVSKRLALAMNVGPLSARLIEHNVKDVELLYTFNKLEKVDKPMAAQLIEEILSGTAGRKEIADALAGRETEAKEETKKDTQTRDLFAQEKNDSEPETANDKERADKLNAMLLQAMAALNEIRNVTSTAGGHMRGVQARNIADNAIKAIDAMAIEL